MNYFDVANGLSYRPSPDDYRYYKCTKDTCNKVSLPSKDTIDIPKDIPEQYDPLILRMYLKTILPITIR